MYAAIWLPPLGPKFYREAWWRRISRFLNKFEEDAYQKLISGLNRKCAREARLCSSLHRDSAFECRAATALIDRLWLNVYSTAVVPVALLCRVLNIVNKISKYFINKKIYKRGFMCTYQHTHLVVDCVATCLPIPWELSLQPFRLKFPSIKVSRLVHMMLV